MPDAEQTRGGLRRWDVKTPWTLLLKADAANKEQLERLLSVYREPVYAYYRTQGLSGADAEDCTQNLLIDFFLLRESHKNATPAAGRFRNYLFTAAKNALLDWRRHKGAKRRGGDRKKVPLDRLKGRCEPTGTLTPEQEYDRQWALSTWSAAIEIFKASGDPALVEALELFYFDAADLSQKEAAAKLGISVAAFNSRIHTARKQLLECIKRVVGATVEKSGELNEELEHLRSVYSELGMV